MPARTALVLRADFSREGALLPRLAGKTLRPSEAKRVGLALLRDLVEKAHRCAGLDPLVAYAPPERRGEVEEAIGSLGVWSEPATGPSPAARAAGILRHLLQERAYRSVVLIDPGLAHTPRQRIFDAVHRLSAADIVMGQRDPDPLMFVGVKGEVDESLFLPGLSGAQRASGLRAGHVQLPPAIATEEDLARAAFDLRAELATRQLAHDDAPAHTLELIGALGLKAAVGPGDAIGFGRTRSSRGGM